MSSKTDPKYQQRLKEEPDVSLREVPKGADLDKCLKLGQLASKALKDEREHEEAKQLDPHEVSVEAKQLDPQEVSVDPCNRDGAPPNVMYIHPGILKGMKDLGSDPSRPKVGMCVHYTSPAGLANQPEQPDQS